MKELYIIMLIWDIIVKKELKHIKIKVDSSYLIIL